jgi:hypothetical protein
LIDDHLVHTLTVVGSICTEKLLADHIRTAVMLLPPLHNTKVSYYHNYINLRMASGSLTPPINVASPPTTTGAAKSDSKTIAKPAASSKGTILTRDMILDELTELDSNHAIITSLFTTSD